MDSNSKIYVAGHTGLVGSSIVRKLKSKGFTNLILKTRSELNLFNYSEVLDFFDFYNPEYVFLSAAKCGGIGDNLKFPVEYLQENLEIQNNIIKSSYETKVKKLLFLGSSCIYPKSCPQPMKEEYLLSGYLEESNESYSIAKISGIKLCQAYKKQYGCNFISVQPCNIYGSLDKFDVNAGHVIGALMNKFHYAKVNKLSSVTCWGTGIARREFLYADDLSDALLFLMQNYNDYDIINIGSGNDISIFDLANLISTVVGYDGKIEWDTNKPDGMLKKLLDVKKINDLGWKSMVSLEEGLKLTYQHYTEDKN